MLQFAAQPAERMRGARLVEDFRDAPTVARNKWTAFGAPTYAQNGGVILNGATQYLTRPLTRELNSTVFTIHVEFYPTFAANDGAYHTFYSSEVTSGGNFALLKKDNGDIICYCGVATTLVATGALAVYQAYWRVNQRNVLSLSLTSGVNTMWLNGNQITTNATAWSTASANLLYAGMYVTANRWFAGRLDRLYIGHHTSTLAEHQAYYNQTMFNWRNRATVALQLRMQDYDPTNVRTLDSSGHANHFTLGDGVTAATFPAQGNGRMIFDGGDSLRYASMAQPVGAFSAAIVVKDNTGAGANDYVAYHADAAFTDVVWTIIRMTTGIWRFYVGGSAYVYSSAYLDSAVRSVIGTWDGTTAQIYINGVLDKAGTVNAPAQPAGAVQPVRLGSTTGATGYLTGTIYDFKYFDGLALNNVQALDYHQDLMRRIGSEV